jgi:hypothetical protein
VRLLRFVRFVLWIVLISSAGIWFVAAVHGFNGKYCFYSGRSCRATDTSFSGYIVAWSGLVVMMVSAFSLHRIRRSLVVATTRAARDQRQMMLGFQQIVPVEPAGETVASLGGTAPSPS